MIDVSRLPEEASRSGEREEERKRAILLTSADAELVTLLHSALTAAGFLVSANIETGGRLQHWAGDACDLVLLDTASCGDAGVQTVREIRARSDAPIVVLSSCRHRGDLVEMLDAGADDYVGEPIDTDEVVARIRAVLRRTDRCGPLTGEHLQVGGIRLATAARAVSANGETIALTSVEYEVLEHLARRAGRAVSREELMAVIGRRHPSPFDRSVDVHVSHLRRKLRQSGRQIRSIRGVGYMLTAAAPD